MSLKHIISHRIQRTTPESPSHIQLAEAELERNGITDEWFRDLKYNVLRRSGKEYGRFSENTGETPLPVWFAEFQAEKLGFKALSERFMQHFRTHLDAIECFADGFLVFAFETLEQDSLLHIFFIQHETCLYLDGDLRLGQSLRLDVNNVRLAVKLSCNDWQSEEAYRQSNALTLLRWRGEKELTDAFVSALGFADKVDTAAETEAFLQTVEAFTEQMPEELAHHTRKQVVEYCLEQESHGRPVVMQELATHIHDHMPQAEQSRTQYAPPAPLDQYVKQHSPKIKPELRADKNRIRNYIRISGRNELLSMSFASSCLGDSIVYDPQSDSLTVKTLPSSLKNKLKKHRNDQD